jgi:para-nitrobenzyl esterase
MAMAAIVETRSGKLEGSEIEGVRVFRGIPFAKPPVGSLRFAPPERELPWKGVRKALAFGPSAPQVPLALPLPGMDVGEQDEDCLYLNVYAPASASAPGEARPVMVWIHGGGFVIGSGSQPLYDGVPLVKRGDVVLVTVNYRLGPLGFLYLNELCPGLEGTAGNLGIRDQVAALEWVAENIAAFGGDPGTVTIFGESAGGMSVGTLLGMPSARGLFHRAIPQSGAAHNVHTRETATRVAEHFLEQLGVAPKDAARLREISPDKLRDTQQQTVMKLGSSVGLLPFQPLVDGDSLPESPLDAVRAGHAAHVPLLTGTTRDEWKLFGMMDPSVSKLDAAGLQARLARQLGAADAARVIEAYRGARETRGAASPAALHFAIETDRVFWIPAVRLIEAQTAHQSACFMYRFDWASPSMGGALGACHGIELAFVFGLVDRAGAQLFSGGGPEAERLSRRVIDAWVAFARSGDPSHSDLPGGRWEAYEGSDRKTLMLDSECRMVLDPDAREREVWQGLL